MASFPLSRGLVELELAAFMLDYALLLGKLLPLCERLGFGQRLLPRQKGCRCRQAGKAATLHRFGRLDEKLVDQGLRDGPCNLMECLFSIFSSKICIVQWGWVEGGEVTDVILQLPLVFLSVLI